MTPDVEALFLAVLDPLGRVSTRIPRPRPDTFIRVSLAGGQGERFFDEVSVIVEAFAPTTVGASELARNARHLLHAKEFDVVDGWQFYGIDSAYPVNFPEDVSERYQFLANVRVRRSN